VQQADSRAKLVQATRRNAPNVLWARIQQQLLPVIAGNAVQERIHCPFQVQTATFVIQAPIQPQEARVNHQLA
jgi:hypothetical protein